MKALWLNGLDPKNCLGQTTTADGFIWKAEFVDSEGCVCWCKVGPEDNPNSDSGFLISNEQLADLLIERLNELIKDPDVRRDISTLFETRIKCSVATAGHPTIQAVEEGFGTLGLLNGLVGTIGEGKRKGWGFITAVYDDSHGTDPVIIRFERTNENPTRT